MVVAGGDGSLHAVVTALYRRDDLAGTVLGLVPLGTGNDFARTIGIPLDRGRRPRRARREPRPMDLIVDEVADRRERVHVGAGAEASRNGPAGRTASARSGSARPTSASSATRSGRR